MVKSHNICVLINMLSRRIFGANGIVSADLKVLKGLLFAPAFICFWSHAFIYAWQHLSFDFSLVNNYTLEINLTKHF